VTMAAGTLYTYPANFRAYKALIAAKYSGADVKVDQGFKFGETNKSASFLEKFPMGKVPAFSSNNNVNISESNAIAHYVGNAQLRGEGAEAEAAVRQWVDFGDNEILPAACTWVFPTMGVIQFNKQETARAQDQVKKAMAALDQHLLTRTYLVGEKVTQADISLACNMLMLYQQVMDPEFRKPYRNVNRWFTTIVNQPNFKAVAGEVTLATKMAQFDSKKYNELHGSAGGKDNKKEKKEKAPKQTPKKQEKKKEKEPEEEEEPPKPKEKKDPWAGLDKGKWDMDLWKRTYSNEDIATKAIPFFWENFDKDRYSLWYCEYTEDLSDCLTFQTCNLVSGMLQRLEKLRKHAFAAMGIFGENKKNSIAGVWMWMGQGLAFELCEDWQVDYESYSWRKLDPDNEADKKIVNAYWITDEHQDYGEGRTGQLQDSKVYK